MKRKDIVNRIIEFYNNYMIEQVDLTRKTIEKLEADVDRISSHLTPRRIRGYSRHPEKVKKFTKELRKTLRAIEKEQLYLVNALNSKIDISEIDWALFTKLTDNVINIDKCSQYVGIILTSVIYVSVYLIDELTIPLEAFNGAFGKNHITSNRIIGLVWKIESIGIN